MATEAKQTGGRASGLQGVPLKCPGCGRVHGVLRRNERFEAVAVVMVSGGTRMEATHSMRVVCRCKTSFWMGLGGVKKA